MVAGLGALGSATCHELARRGHRVVGLERFELGHARGASHDTSRILRHSYHTPAYVRLTQEAYADWARLERDSGEDLVTVVGGLDLFPPEAAISPVDYTTSLDAVGIDHERARSAGRRRRWPQFRLPEGTLVLHQPDAAIVPAGRGTRVMQEQARRRGADLREQTPVTAVRDLGAGGLEVETTGGVLHCERTGRVRGRLDQRRAGRPGRAGAARGDARAGDLLPAGTSRRLRARKAAAVDLDGRPVVLRVPVLRRGRRSRRRRTAAGRSSTPTTGPRTGTPTMEDRLARHMRSLLPGSGAPVRSLRCQYTLTPDRDFVLSAGAGHPSVVVGMGAAHGFKFAPTFGRLLADLAVDGRTSTDVTPFRMDRPGLTDPAYQAHWLV